MPLLCTLHNARLLCAQAGGGAPAESLQPGAQALLELWDGICVYFSGQAKPAAWLSVLLRALRLVSPDARRAAAAAAQVQPFAGGRRKLLGRGVRAGWSVTQAPQWFQCSAEVVHCGSEWCASFCRGWGPRHIMWR